MHRISRTIIYYCIIFILLYFELLYFFGWKFSVLWKIPLLIIIIAYLIRRQVATIPLSKWWYWYSLKNLLNYSSLNYLKDNILLSCKIPVIGLFTPFLHTYFCRNKWNLSKAFNLLYFFSVFIIVSCIPFLLGLIESYGEEYNLTDFGVEEVGFCGLFHSSHSCAWVVTITLFNLFYLFNISLSIRKRYWIALLILIGFFVLYKTYVRTGYLMFFIGCLFFFKNKIVSVKKRLKYILWGIIFVVLGYSYLSQDDVLMSRLTDSRVYNTDQTDAERLGSGRLLFISISIDYWMQAPFMVQLFGYGQEMAIQNMEEKMGLKVFSHNGFVDAFVQNGLIGLLLLIVILISFKKQINKIKGHSYYDVCNAIFFMYIAFQLVQGGYSFMFDFIIALNLSITMLIIRKIQPLKH